MCLTINYKCDREVNFPVAFFNGGDGDDGRENVQPYIVSLRIARQSFPTLLLYDLYIILSALFVFLS